MRVRVQFPVMLVEQGTIYLACFRASAIVVCVVTGRMGVWRNKFDALGYWSLRRSGKYEWYGGTLGTGSNGMIFFGQLWT